MGVGVLENGHYSIPWHNDGCSGAPVTLWFSGENKTFAQLVQGTRWPRPPEAPGTGVRTQQALGSLSETQVQCQGELRGF